MTDRHNLASAAHHVLSALSDAGLAATADPRQVEIPGAFVVLERMRWYGLDGSTELDVACYLIAPDNGDHLVNLSALLELAAPALPWTSDRDMPLVTLELPDRALPAIQLSIRLTLS